MPLPKNIWLALWSRRKLLVGIVFTALLYTYYVSGLSYNPPGFYLDESAGSYNAYLIATTGQSEFGDLPLYPKYYTGTNSEQGNPTHLYMLALMYVFVPPSVVSARILAASTVFAATLLLGFLAFKISGSRLIGIIVGITAMFTPWIFDASRLVLEVFTYPLSVALFLWCLYNASKREKWTLLDNCLLAATLALVTYSYSIGRLLGPALAFGLIIFAVNRNAIVMVLKTWIAFGISLIPLAIFTVTKPGALSKRFVAVTYLSWEKTILQNIQEFFEAFISDISPQFLLYAGDPLLRHHVPVMGELLAATFVLAVVGLVLVILRHRGDAWWRFIVYGMIVSFVPGVLTLHRHHSLRMSAVPVFVLILTVPALEWLLGRKCETESASGLATSREPSTPGRSSLLLGRTPGFAVLSLVLILTAFQTITYQKAYWDIVPNRGYVFDEPYPAVLNEALAQPVRPIYLEDGFWGPAYIHAFWYGTIQNIDLSNFIHITDNTRPPAGSVVLTSHNTCNRCEILVRRGSFMLYKTNEREGIIESTLAHAPTQTPVVEKPGGPESESAYTSRSIALDAKAPHGIAVDSKGNIYIADSGNSRVQKLSAIGDILATIGTAGSGDGELITPTGVAVDESGHIYVSDTSAKRLVKFKSDGTYVSHWSGSENGLDAPLDVEIGADKQVYLADGSRAGLVRFNPETGSASAWGTNGSNDRESGSLMGIGSAGDNVFAADMQNDRIQVFGPDGRFIRQWPVHQWSKYIWHRPDVAADLRSNLVYVTSGWTNEVLVFDMEGNYMRSLKPGSKVPLINPSSIVLSDTKNGKYLYVLNTGSDVVQSGNPRIAVFEFSNIKN